MSERRRFKDRLRWQGVAATLEEGVDRALVARLLAVLFGLAGVLLLITLGLAGDQQREPEEMAALAMFTIVVAIVLYIGQSRLPLWALELAPALGTVVACAQIYFAGPSASASYAMYLAWVVIGSALFFKPRLVVLHGAFAIIAYVSVLGLRDPEDSRAALQIAMIAGTIGAVGFVMAGLANQLRGVMGRLETAARTDPLTGILNRRAFADECEREISRAARAGQPVGVVMLDLDGFKAFNDRNGHPAGDKVLQRLSYVLQDGTRTIDHVGRMGGEEFAVMAPESDLRGTLAMAERLRRAVEVEFSGDDPLTASLGVASYPANGHTCAALLSAADRALYEAKAMGKNRASASRQRAEAPGASREPARREAG